jgi:AcrR family transcriptional regulator
MAKTTTRAQARARTRNRILAIAEKNFANSGYSGTSLRDIATEADVPIALIYYYFESKAKLYDEVLERHTANLNPKRIERLDRLRAAGAPLDPVLEDLVVPLIHYALRGGPTSRRFTQLLARIFFYSDKESVELVKKHFDPLARRFIDELARVLPALDRRTLAWLYSFSIGAAIGSLASEDRVGRLATDEARFTAQEIEDLAVTFVVGGAKAVAASLGDTKKAASMGDSKKKGARS